MAAIPPAPININGHEWQPVWGTTAEDVYRYDDVVRAGGKTPTTITVSNETYIPEPPPSRSERRGYKKKQKKHKSKYF